MNEWIQRTGARTEQIWSKMAVSVGWWWRERERECVCVCVCVVMEPCRAGLMWQHGSIICYIRALFLKYTDCRFNTAVSMAPPASILASLVKIVSHFTSSTFKRQWKTPFMLYSRSNRNKRDYRRLMLKWPSSQKT